MTPRRTLLGLYLYLAAACLPAGAEAVRLTSGLDDPPFTDSARPDGGIVTRLVIETFRAAGTQPKLDRLPWRRGYSLAKSGEYQAGFPFLKTPERERDFFFSDPVFTDFSYLWTRAGDPLSPEDPARFKGRTICVPQGYHSPLQDLLAAGIARGEVAVNHPETPEKCVQMLVAGRVDAMSSQEKQIALSIQALGMAGLIAKCPTPLARLDFHVVFPRAAAGSAGLLARFNAALRQMRESGRYTALTAG